jgi:hypothetical protein
MSMTGLDFDITVPFEWGTREYEDFKQGAFDG